MSPPPTAPVAHKMIITERPTTTASRSKGHKSMAQTTPPNTVNMEPKYTYGEKIQILTLQTTETCDMIHHPSAAPGKPVINKTAGECSGGARDIQLAAVKYKTLASIHKITIKK
jgi:hypothetical protein